MTQEDYEYLLQYEHTFYTAAKQAYAKILPRSINEKLNLILNDGQKRNLGCSVCIMGMYKSLYVKLENEKKVHKEPEPIETEIVEKPKSKKKATNKKIKTEE